ncbi:hypothetical protein HDU98_001714 [Podochytrium sp. JEL0797]|nr:hypothetical protein HDU98_001714 [Podochytrium sp. JEL0797]
MPSDLLLLGGNGPHLATIAFNRESRTLSLLQTTNIDQPSWVHTHNDLLITCNEKNPDGRVLAFRLDDKKDLDTMQPVFDLDSGGAHPCHMDVSLDGKWVFAANYTGGTASFHSIDQSPQQSHVIDFRGLNPNVTPHPHMAIMNPYESIDSKRIYIPDLGSDRLHIIKQDPTTGTPTLSPEFLTFPQGSGPRHIAFHPNGTHAYVNLELSSQLAVVSIHPTLEILSLHSLLPPGRTREDAMQSAAVEVSPDARFVYLSNRKDPESEDTVVWFPIGEDGRVEGTERGLVRTGGKGPRGFKISGDGRWVCVVNQGSDNVVMFERDLVGGGLVRVVGVELVKGFEPTCVVWV